MKPAIAVDAEGFPSEFLELCGTLDGLEERKETWRCWLDRDIMGPGGGEEC